MEAKILLPGTGYSEKSSVPETGKGTHHQGGGRRLHQIIEMWLGEATLKLLILAHFLTLIYLVPLHNYSHSKSSIRPPQSVECNSTLETVAHYFKSRVCLPARLSCWNASIPRKFRRHYLKMHGFRLTTADKNGIATSTSFACDLHCFKNHNPINIVARLPYTTPITLFAQK